MGLNGKIICKIVISLLTLGVMGFIFEMSAMNANESSKLSTSVGYTVGEIVLKDFDEMPQKQQEDFVLRIEHPLRKMAHFTEFSALGFLLLLDVSLYTELAGAKRFVLAAVIGLLYAASDEMHQLLVSGRSGEFVDVMIDVSGVILGCIAACIIMAVMKVLYPNKSDD